MRDHWFCYHVSMDYESMDKSELLLEISRLKKKLDDYLLKYGPLEEERFDPHLDLAMNTEEKLSVFMDYFAGRPDVIAERYEIDGVKHYSLGCQNKFNVRAGCDIKKSHCKNCHAFLPKPYDQNAVREHMRSKRTMKGIYPILFGNYVRFLVFDLDKSTYIEDAKRLYFTLRSHYVSSLLERSESGHGIHLWVFFEKKVKASEARKIANYILTEAMDRYGGFGFDSYDRIFPNQDKVTDGGYGNCVALPLNAEFAQEGNTVFLDEGFNVIPKPIEYLSTVKKVSPEKVKELLAMAEQKEEYGLFGMKALKMPLSQDDFAKPVHVHYAGDVYIPLLDLSSRATRFLARLTSILNKEYFKLLAARGSVRGIPKILSSYKVDKLNFRLPRGYKDDLVSLLRAKNIEYVYTSSLTKGETVDVSLKLALREEQISLLELALEKDSAIIAAPTGFGKTVIAAAIMARKKTNALVLVPSKNLLSQWVARLESYLTVGESNARIGTLSGSGDRLSGEIDVATIQSLVRNEAFQKKAKNYGLVIIDEAHHASAFKYEAAIRELCPKYLYGLTATPERSDEREEFAYRCIGPLVQLEEEPNSSDFLRYYHPRFTKFTSELGGDAISSLFLEATRDKERNRLIIDDVTAAYDAGKKILLLTERIEHAKTLYGCLQNRIEDVVILYGGQSKGERIDNEQRMSSFEDRPFIVVSIGKYIGEGFDDPRFDALFITYPFRWKGILAQYCGRLQRKNSAIKRVDVYDYVDALVPSFSRMYSAREKGYHALGYQIENLNPAYHSRILSTVEMDKVLFDDLSAAKESVSFFASYFHEHRLKKMIGLATCPYSVFVVGGTPADDFDNVQRLSRSVPNMVIIDRRIVFYGGLNPYVYGNKDGTIMRVEDPMVAKDILEGMLAKT